MRCTMRPVRSSGLLLLAVLCTFFWADAAELMPDRDRVAEIAAMLPPAPRGLGQPVDQRPHWDALAASDMYRSYAGKAARDLDEPFPAVTEEFYREINRTGSRPKWYGFDNDRWARFRRYVLAECLENRGRFMPRIEQALDTVASEATWYVPLLKQGSLDNFEGRRTGIDLYVAMRSWEIALTDWMLGPKLNPETRTRVRTELHRRTLDPFLAMLRGDQPAEWWLRTTNNWNAVCLSGVVGTALTLVESRDERALFVAAAEKLSRNFLHGFPDDGYCTEGLGYWNFGFGHYVCMTETILQATGGALDLFDVPNIRKIASFGDRIEIVNGVYPAIADCSPGTRPDAAILYYSSRRLGLGLTEWDTVPVERRARGHLYQLLIALFPNAADTAATTEQSREQDTGRSFFDSIGVLICRPAPGTAARLAACMKGGHNAEHHTHNDVGSFTVALGNEAPITDVGAEIYTNDTFSPRRYDSDANNSYGHSTPVVAGTLQRPGRDAAATVLAADFSDEEDTFALDLKAAYDVPALRTLQRTFVYSRKDEGALRITDRFEYDSPQTFEVGLTTLGDIRILSPRSALFYTDFEAVRADLETTGGDVALSTAVLTAQLRGGRRGTRLAIAFAEPLAQGSLTVRVTPAPHPYVKPGGTIVNGGFELGLKYWDLSARNSMCTLTDQRSASGNHALHVVDTSETGGSSAFSNSFPMQAGKIYELRGSWFGVSGKDLGVVTRFYDENDVMLDLPDDDVRLAGTVFLGGDAKEWQPFSKPFTAPPGTHFARLWIHSLNAAVVEAFLDDLDIVPQ